MAFLICSIVLLVVVQQAASDTGPACKNDCVGLQNGDYQSCDTCTAYHTCSNGYIIANRPCPAGTVWNDLLKRCEYQSSTCNAACSSYPCLNGATCEPTDTGFECTCTAGHTGTTCDTVLTTGPTTGPTCISECGDLLEGTYQSCVACNEFHDCREGGHIIPCPADLIWDDNNKRCEYTSVTCTDWR